MATRLINKGFNGWSQLGVFLGMWGGGVVIGSLASVVVWKIMTGQGIMNMEQDMLNTAYAGAIKVIQFVSTLFVFFIPAVLYGWICYRNGWLALGFRKSFSPVLLLISILLLGASIPLIGTISDLNQAIPLPKTVKAYFDSVEKNYEEQVKVIGDVRTFGQYLLSIFMIALLPAVFEETLFRGGLQNMLSRWKNNSVIYVCITAGLLVAAKMIWFKQLNTWFFLGCLLGAILIVYRLSFLRNRLNKITNHFLFPIIFISILFSAVHASWYGFLPRVALGMLLGLLFHYTNNLSYNILAHFANNAVVITSMYYAATHNEPAPAGDMPHLPWWTAIFSIMLLGLLFWWLTRVNKLEKPQEVFLSSSNPFENTIFEQQNNP